MTSGYQLSPEAKTLATVLAEKSFQKYQNVRGHYRNAFSSHLIGRLGDFAAYFWFRDQGLNPVINIAEPNGDRICDIDTDVGRCEVKTWRAEHWDDLGRAVTVSQLPSIKKKADFIFWCVADDYESETPKVQLKGWSNVDAIDKDEPLMTGKIGRQIFNYQISVDDIQNLELLKQGKNGQGRNTSEGN